MIKDLSVDHLLGIKQLTAEDIEIIFETADTFKKIINRPIKKVPTVIFVRPTSSRSAPCGVLVIQADRS